MPDDAAAKKAIKELDKGKIDGQEINVMEAKVKEEREKRRPNRSFKENGHVS
jgi:hypothetical protein